MNSTRSSLPNFNSPFSMACFLPIGWFLTQTKSLSGQLILMSAFLLGNKESGRPGVPCVLTPASHAQAAAGKALPSFVPFLLFLHPPCRAGPTPLPCRGQCLAIPTAIPKPFSSPVPSYISSSPIPFHSLVAPSAALSLAVQIALYPAGPSCTPGWRYPWPLDSMFSLSHKSQAPAPIFLFLLLLPVAAADKKSVLV